jgi:hypothetical protein
MVTATTATQAPAPVDTTEEDERRKKEAMRGLFDWLNPFNWGIGNMLMLGLLAVGAYFLATTENGKKFLSNAGDWLKETFSGFTGWLAKTFPGLASYLAPEEMTKAAEDIGDKDAPGRLIKLLSEEGVALTGDSAIADKAILRAMREEGPYLAAIAKRSAGGTGTDSNSARVLASVKAFVAKPENIQAALAPELRATTFALLEAASPVPFAPGKLGAFITKIGLDTSGKATPLLGELITGLTGDSAAQTRAMMQLVRRVDQPTMQALLGGVDTSKIQDAALRDAVEQAKGLSASAATYGQVQQLAGNIAPEKLSAFMGTVAGGKLGDSLNMLARDPELRGAFAKMDAQKLPATLRDAVDFIKTATPRELAVVARMEARFNNAGGSFVDYYTALSTNEKGQKLAGAALSQSVVTHLLDPAFRAPLRNPQNTYDLAVILNEQAAHTRDPADRATKAFLGTMQGNNPHNLNLLVNFVDQVAKQPANQSERTLRLVNGIVGMASGDPKLASQFSQKDLGEFIKVPANASLLASLLQKLDVSKLAAPQRELFVKYRGSISAVLRDPASRDTVGDLVANGSGKFTTVPGDWGLAAAANAIGEAWFWNISGATPTMKAHRSELESLADISSTLGKAGVQTGTAAAPAQPRTAASPAQRS